MTCSRFNRLTLCAAGFAILIVAGCAGLLGGESAPIRYYVLSEVPRTDETRPPAGPASEVVVAVVDVTMADYLDNQTFVTRTTANIVDLAQFDQWAAPFGRHVTRTLKNNIAVLIPSKRVLLSPLSIPVTVDYEVRADIQTFEQDPDGEVVLEARWGLLDLSRRDSVVLRSFDVRKPVASDPPSEGATETEIATQRYSAIAAAMSSALADMSVDIATAIREKARGRN